MRLEHTVQIAAPLDVVWAATANVTAWPDWTPTITSVQPLSGGRVGVGGRYLLKQPMQAKAIWEVTGFDEGKRFVWERRGAFLRFRATHQLEPVNDGTRNTLILEAYGPCATLMWPLIRPTAARALAEENAGLKAFCEGAPGAVR